MVTFENGVDARCREPSAPTVAKIRITPAGWHHSVSVYRFCVIGTAYGFWHTSGGDVRTWQTASGARRAAKRYQPL